MPDFSSENKLYSSLWKPQISEFTAKADTPKLPEENVFQAEKATTKNTKDESVFKFGLNDMELGFEQFIKEKPNTEDGLAKEINGWYVLKDNNARQEHLNEHLSKFDNDKAQLTEIEKLIKAGVTETDFKLLAGTHKALIEKNVVPTMAKIINVDGNEEKKTIAGCAVAREVKNLDKKHQYQVSELVVKTANKKVIETGSKDVSKLDKTVQVKTHALYFETKDKDVQKILTEQYAQYDKDCQIGIHKKTMTSDYQEIINLGTTNIQQLHADNQLEAAKITLNTNNKEAAKILAAITPKLNDKTKEDVQKLVETALKNIEKQSGLKSEIKESTITQPQKAELVAEKKETEKLENESRYYSNLNVLSKASINEATISEKIEFIKSSAGSYDMDQIQDIFQKASDAEKLTILERLPKSIIAPILNKLIKTESSTIILSQITKMLNGVASSDKKELIKNMNENFSSSLFAKKVTLLDTESQQLFLKEMAKTDSLKLVEKQYLDNNAKKIFTELEKENRRL